MRKIIVPDKAGFTFVEVLVALVVVAIASLVFMTVFPNTFNGVRQAQLQGALNYTAQMSLENSIAGDTSGSIVATSVMTFAFDSTTITVHGDIYASSDLYVFVAK